MSTEQQPTSYTAHYISGTHWDREWYRPFQEFRLLLVEVVDGLLELMEKSTDFRYFHLDGQTCVLADYLEVRPENRPRLERLIREGRILIGPWFTMPDLFCPGDEALLRNLLLGRHICREWGVEPMPVAYTCDMFGHPSQMPQIYRGFGLRHCVLGRGTNESTTPAFFTWEAPDGSRVFTFKLQDKMGYGAFLGARGVLERAGGAEDATAEQTARDSLREYVEHEIGRTNGATLCLIDACDHMPPAADAARYLRVLHEACPTVAARHSTLPEFFADAEAAARDLPVRRGEQREPAEEKCEYLYLIPNCVSSRVRMKMANDACQVLLEKWAEPWLALANLHGAALPTHYLRIAWQHLLLNHAHDSICGCSIDQVHRDMQYRYDQVAVLGNQLRNKAFGALTAQCTELATAPDEFTVTLANPLSRARREVVVFNIDLPPDYPATFHEGFRSQELLSFTLSDVHGQEVPYQRLAWQPETSERTRFAITGMVSGLKGSWQRYTVAAEVALPALGFTSLLVKPSEQRVRRIGSLRNGPTSAENEYLRLDIAPNGTLTLTDKLTGETYRDLLTFEDSAEIGDGWFHGPSLNDEVVLSSASPAQVSVLYDGPELVTFAVAVTLNLPHHYDWHRQCRAAERVDMRLTSHVTLRRGARTLEVETTVENTAEDHRLRLLLPSDVPAKTYFAHHPYDLVERSIALDARTTTWSEMEIPEKPFLGLQAIAFGRRGLIFLAQGGVHEGGVVDDARHTMLVTLLRSYRRTIGNPEEPDGLEMGPTTFRYALLTCPAKEPRTEALEALEELAKLQAGLLTRQTGPVSSGFPPLTGSLPPEQSFLAQQNGTLIVSAVKPSEDEKALIVRLWNPAPEPQQEILRFSRPVGKAEYVQLSEEADTTAAPPVVQGETVTVTAGCHGIITLRVEL